MKIFQLTEYEWWFGETLEAIYLACERQTGSSEKEMREDFEPVEVHESEWDVPNRIKLSEDGEPKEMGSYRDALEQVAACDGSTAGLLCGPDM